MIITCEFDKSFEHQNVDNRRFTVDIDPNEDIDNLKTLITLKYTDLDPESFDLYL